MDLDVCDATDYVKGLEHSFEIATTNSKSLVKAVYPAGANGSPLTVMTASTWTTVTLVILRHIDSSVTDNVTVSCRPTGAAGATSFTLTSDGMPLVFPSLVVGTALTLESAGATNPAIEVTLLGT